MYRILIARGGSYYVQQHSGWNGWHKIGGFFLTRKAARQYIQDLKRLGPNTPRVVEYV